MHIQSKNFKFCFSPLSDAGRDDDSQLKVTNKDNRSLVDNNSAQSLSGEDIESMRRLGHYIQSCVLCSVSLSEWN